MLPINEFEKCAVVIFDIEGYSKKTIGEQAKLVKDFVVLLDQRIEADLKDLEPDVFSTGDGAILSIGRAKKATRKSVDILVSFVEKFIIEIQQKGLILRTAIHYSDFERVVVIKELKNIQGNFIQIGRTVNTASRIIQYCEPKEIIISKSVFDCLIQEDSVLVNKFFQNELFTTKHGERLLTYSYISDSKFIYSPNCPTHQYKKYNFFPPINGKTIQYYMNIGLGHELKKIISHAFDSIKDINYNNFFVSSNTVVNVLIQLQYDPTDTVYVLSRNERKANFWTQRNKNVYIDYLKKNSDKHNKSINQTRVKVYDFFSNSSTNSEITKDDIHYELINLHNHGTYFAVPSNIMYRFENLEALLFGITISKKHKFAIIPLPAPENMDVNIQGIQSIKSILAALSDYDAEHGPMRAIIMADERQVDKLIQEFEALLNSPERELIK